MAQHPRILAAGHVASTIAQTARNGFDLIMMPTHAGVFRRMLLGSTTARVLDEADCPVETSLYAETIVPRPVQHRELVCAVGLSQDSERVLRFAHRAAQETGSNLRIIHAIQSADPRLPIRLDLEETIQSEEQKQVRERIRALQRKVGSNAQVQIAVGPVRDGAGGKTVRRRRIDHRPEPAAGLSGASARPDLLDGARLTVSRDQRLIRSMIPANCRTRCVRFGVERPPLGFLISPHTAPWVRANGLSHGTRDGACSLDPGT